MKSYCTVCNSSAYENILNLGDQPPSNRFIRPDETESEECFPLSIGACVNCGTIQLVDRLPIEAIRPRFDWLQNSEAEGHLDDMVKRLTGLPNVDRDSAILGVSYKDASTLDRFEALGFNNTDNVSISELDGGEGAGLETLQMKLSDTSLTNGLRLRYGRAKLLIVRHLVEHAESAFRFISSLCGLLDQDGYMVFEFPDNSRIFRNSGHAFIWEEHFSYFTRESFANLANHIGAEVVFLHRYAYPFEDALVGVLRFKNDSCKKIPARADVSEELGDFVSSFSSERRRWKTRLSELNNGGHKVAVFGAGHLAVKFINFMDLGDYIDCVIDDNPNKSGLLMPGSRLPIVPSTELAARGIGHCISTLSPESEIRVRKNLSNYFASGGLFIPAFNFSEGTL